MTRLLITPIISVIKKNRMLLDQPGSRTGTLVGRWAKIMVLPQFFLAPLTILFGRIEGPLIFLARFLAMHLVHQLDGKVPYTRALGICHLATFGPLFVWFSIEFGDIYNGWGIFGTLFLIEYVIIAICLLQDIRDLLLYMTGRPYPCYVRDYHRIGRLDIDDKRVEQPVTGFSTFLW